MVAALVSSGDWSMQVEVGEWVALITNLATTIGVI